MTNNNNGNRNYNFNNLNNDIGISRDISGGGNNNNDNSGKIKKYLPIILAAVIVLTLAALAAVLIFKGKENTDENSAADDDPYSRPEISETRGVFVPSVFNLAFPSKPDLSDDELKAEIDSIIKKAKEIGLNSIFFQVRPACDALYDSDIFPTSEYLSTDGERGFDCLEYFVNECHKEKMALHAWINPLRVSASKSDLSELAKDSPALKIENSVVSYAGKLYFDPGIPEVRELVCRGVREICEKYNVDGIIFDDYFYPYKVYTTAEDGTSTLAAFADEKTFETYGGDFSSIDDFRRANINELIKSVYETVKDSDEECLFGVSCFGIWQNINGENGGSHTHGSESYSETYSDTLSWVEGGYVDYVAPQIYWETNNLAASYKVLAKWWDSKLENTGVSLLIAHAAYKYDGTFNPSEGEMTRQLVLNGELSNCKGSIFYSFASLRDNIGGVTDEITKYYAERESAESKDTQSAEN